MSPGNQPAQPFPRPLSKAASLLTQSRLPGTLPQGNLAFQEKCRELTLALWLLMVVDFYGPLD